MKKAVDRKSEYLLKIMLFYLNVCFIGVYALSERF